MDTNLLLAKVLSRITKDDAVQLLHKKNPSWAPSKKPKNKRDIQDDFIALSGIIKENEVKDLVEMAVMKRTVGLPAYTYKLTEVPTGKIKDYTDYPVDQVYSITTKIDTNNSDVITAHVVVKEYKDYWKNGSQQIESLTAVYQYDISLDKKSKVMTIHAGNHEIHEVIRNFFSYVMKWKITPLRISTLSTSTSASYKTGILIDFIYNRLKSKGISSTITELKFSTSNASGKKDGVLQVTLHGEKDIISSARVCEYITLGCDIIYFKLNTTHNNNDFSATFYLLGKNNDTLKMVINGIDDAAIRNTTMKIIQSEYINMCEKGYLNKANTDQLLDKMYKTFLNSRSI